jgi:hypothetical protein
MIVHIGFFSPKGSFMRRGGASRGLASPRAKVHLQKPSSNMALFCLQVKATQHGNYGWLKLTPTDQRRATTALDYS